jgi:hypothetical protein
MRIIWYFYIDHPTCKGRELLSALSKRGVLPPKKADRHGPDFELETRDEVTEEDMRVFAKEVSYAAGVASVRLVMSFPDGEKCSRDWAYKRGEYIETTTLAHEDFERRYG